jgi:hypothetical protein
MKVIPHYREVRLMPYHIDVIYDLSRELDQPWNVTLDQILTRYFEEFEGELYECKRQQYLNKFQ